MTVEVLDAAHSDAELIERVRNGDTSAFSELYTRHQKVALGVARHALDNSSDAEDVVADSFSQVLEKLNEGKGPDNFFRAYLLSIVKRQSYARNTGAGKVALTDVADDLDVEQVFSDPSVEAFENSAVATAFKSLPVRWQEVLWYLDVERAKPGDVAPIMGMSANAISALALRARDGLRNAYLQAHVSDVVPAGCQSFADKLGPYVRGGLSKSASAKVAAHVDECARCSVIVMELKDVRSRMRLVLAPLLIGVTPAVWLLGEDGERLLAILSGGAATAAGATAVAGVTSQLGAAASGAGVSSAAGAAGATGTAVGAAGNTTAVGAAAGSSVAGATGNSSAVGAAGATPVSGGAGLASGGGASGGAAASGGAVAGNGVLVGAGALVAAAAAAAAFFVVPALVNQGSPVDTKVPAAEATQAGGPVSPGSNAPGVGGPTVAPGTGGATPKPSPSSPANVPPPSDKDGKAGTPPVKEEPVAPGGSVAEPPAQPGGSLPSEPQAPPVSNPPVNQGPVPPVITPQPPQPSSVPPTPSSGNPGGGTGSCTAAAGADWCAWNPSTLP